MPANFENDTILLTCASGKQCSHLIPMLYHKWRKLRLAVNSSASQERLKANYPDAEVVRADMSLIEDARRILSGVTVVLHIGPSFHSHETEIGYTMIDAACHESQYGSLKHFVYSSVLHPQIRKLMNHDCKRYVEEYLIESGLNYTIVQPSHLLDMIPVQKLVQQQDIIFPARFNPKITFSFTVLKDLAEAFVRVFEEREKHYLAEYMACSTGPTSYLEVADTLSQEIGRPVTLKQIEFFESVEEVQKVAISQDENGEIPRASRDVAQRLMLYYNFYGIKGNTNVLEWLIGRKPTSVKAFFQQKLKES